MADTVAVEHDLEEVSQEFRTSRSQAGSFTSFFEIRRVIAANRGLFLSIVGTLLTASVLYCIFAPNTYEATARVALRGDSGSPLGPDYGESRPSGSFASGQVQLETLANEFRSEQIAWEVIATLKLHQTARSFESRFPGFQPDHPDPNARDYLLDQFRKDLTVETIPRTLVLEIRFRSHDARLSAGVVNALIRTYEVRQRNARIQATHDATARLQLEELKKQANREENELIAFQNEHNLLGVPDTLANGRPGEVQHAAELNEVDELSRELVNAKAYRIQMEAEFRAAQSGDPELVLASDPKQQSAGDISSAMFQKLRNRRSELE